jgi:hypothetical protein
MGGKGGAPGRKPGGKVPGADGSRGVGPRRTPG